MAFKIAFDKNYKTKNLAVKLNAKGEQLVVKGHPWVF
jgi:23S rRNA (cytosine1962-C5)-methyltransferase